jgi:hypothetical protein
VAWASFYTSPAETLIWLLEYVSYETGWPGSSAQRLPTPRRRSAELTSHDTPPTLLVDLYELTMAQSYFECSMTSARATFNLFARYPPPGWGFFLASG